MRPGTPHACRFELRASRCVAPPPLTGIAGAAANVLSVVPLAAAGECKAPSYDAAPSAALFGRVTSTYDRTHAALSSRLDRVRAASALRYSASDLALRSANQRRRRPFVESRTDAVSGVDSGHCGVPRSRRRRRATAEAELRSTWRNPMAQLQAAAHAIAKLLPYRPRIAASERQGSIYRLRTNSCPCRVFCIPESSAKRSATRTERSRPRQDLRSRRGLRGWRRPDAVRCERDATSISRDRSAWLLDRREAPLPHGRSHRPRTRTNCRHLRAPSTGCPTTNLSVRP
jgi:hypothetical protein